MSELGASARRRSFIAHFSEFLRTRLLKLYEGKIFIADVGAARVVLFTLALPSS